MNREKAEVLEKTMDITKDTNTCGTKLKYCFKNPFNQLSDEDLEFFFANLSQLQRHEKRTLRFNIGRRYIDAPVKAQMLLLSCLPDNFPEDDVDMIQNLFFTAGIYCLDCDTENAIDDSVKAIDYQATLSPIEAEIAKILANSPYSPSTAKYWAQNICEARTGIYGTLYKTIAHILYKSTARINCYQLMRDLENWNDPSKSVQMRWVTPSLRCLRVSF